MSANYLTFMERAAFVEAFGLDRQIGAGVIYNQDHYTLSAGIFGPTPFADEVWLEDVKTGSRPPHGRSDQPRGQRRQPGGSSRRELAGPRRVLRI